MTIPSINDNSDSDKIKILAKEPKKNAEYKELPIVTFARKYEEILTDIVLPQLSSYEDERKTNLFFAITGFIFFVALGIILLLFVQGEGGVKLAFLSIAFSFILWGIIKKKFERKLKQKVMPKLMNAFPNFYWQEISPISTNEINTIKIFPKSIQATKEFDDCFCGRYRGVSIDISECRYDIKQGKSTINIFRGVIVRLKMNKSFTGITIVRPKNSYMNCSDLKQIHLSEVKLEDVEFCKNYRVFSTDQVEARYLLTTAFMDRFKNMNLNFFAQNAFCVFHDEYVYIAPQTHIDLFNLFSLVKPVTHREQFDVMFRQIYSILALVDYFKLDKKLGL